MGECDLIERCGFFKKYQGTFDLACRGFIASYCKGPKIEECERRKFRIAYGVAPDDDMLPTGQMMPASARR